MTKTAGCLVLTRGRERYVIMFNETPDGISAARKALGRWASDPELSFSWYDVLKANMRLLGLARELASNPQSGKDSHNAPHSTTHTRQPDRDQDRRVCRHP